jgi:hypothetical protein
MDEPAIHVPFDSTADGFGSPERSGLQRAVALSLLFFAILIGLIWLARSRSQRAVTDLVALVSSDPKVAFETGVDTETEAITLIRTRLNIGLRVPTIEGAELVSVSIVELPRGIEIPALGYSGPIIGDQQVFGVDYAFLDRHEGLVYVDPSLRRELEHGNSFSVIDVRGRKDVVVWRSGASILMSPTTDSNALIERIQG